MNHTNKPRDRLAQFLDELFETEGAEGVVSSLSFLFGAFVVTFEGVVIAANDGFLNLVGYAHSELKGMSALDLVVPADRFDLKRRFSSDLINRYELQLLTKGSTIKHVLVSPRIFFSGGRKYRLAEFIDNTEIISLQRAEIENFRSTSTALTQAIECRDPYTKGHMSRTMFIAVKIAKIMGFDSKTIDSISLGASLHDIGKMSVPIEILTKPGKLETHEWEFIKKHPEIGCQILKETNFEKPVKDIVLLHHEHQDGSGYPYGLKGSEIPLEAAIVSVADSLDAIAGVRPYRRAFSFSEAIEEIESEACKYYKEALLAARELVESGRLAGDEFKASF